MTKKALIAMSGGVDSSVAAYLTMAEGFEVTGVTMQLWSEEHSVCDEAHPLPDQNSRDAASVAAQLGFPHCSIGLGDSFRCRVTEPFISAYAAGLTPNPCVSCNRHLKFGSLMDLCRKQGYDCLVTGHYARIEQNEQGEYCLLTAKDSAKDQSYFLWGIRREDLPVIRFPLGNYTKEEIRALAKEKGLPSASRSDSQDICFVPDGDYAAFIEKHSTLDFPRGDFIAPDGKVLGQHQGLIRYTVGQRKGLGIALGEPAFVLKKDASANTVTLGSHEELFSSELTAHSVNLLCKTLPSRTTAKIRYRHAPVPCSAALLADGRLHILFDEPVRAIAPGQSVVLYDGDRLLGGGIIEGDA